MSQKAGNLHKGVENPDYCSPSNGNVSAITSKHNALTRYDYSIPFYVMYEDPSFHNAPVFPKTLHSYRTDKVDSWTYARNTLCFYVIISSRAVMVSLFYGAPVTPACRNVCEGFVQNVRNFHKKCYDRS